MGSTAELYFSDYPVNGTKNYLDQWVLKESDKRTFQRKFSERNNLFWGSLENDELETAYVFEATTKIIISRLEVLGYTLEACERDFKYRVKEEIRQLENIEEYDAEFVKNQRRIYSEFEKFETWLDAFRIIVTEKVKGVYSLDEPRKVHDNKLVNYMLNPPAIWNEDLHLVGFEYPCLDFSIFARAFLEGCGPESLVQLDATDLVLGGWYGGFEHLEDSLKLNTRFFDVLSESLNDIESLIRDGCRKEVNESLLAKLLYANVITVFETYLSTTFVSTVINSPPLTRRTIESDAKFAKQRINLSDLFRRYDGIKEEVSEYLEGLMYHNLPKIKQLYKSVLCVDFPNDLSSIFEAIDIRHDIVHRNGRTKGGEVHGLSLKIVSELILCVRTFVYDVDVQVKNVYPMMLEDDS